MCAMYYYASKLTAAALSGGFIGGGGGGEGGGSGNNSGDGGGGVCRCHEAQKEQRSSPRRATTPQPVQPTRHHHQPRASRVYTPTLGPTITEHVVIEHPRPNHYHRHRTKHKVCEQIARNTPCTLFFTSWDCIIYCKKISKQTGHCICEISRKVSRYYIF
ncbi:hypothetical protein ACS0PU_012830 [Formica fusca]